MISYVVDASALVDLCLGRTVDPGLRTAVADGSLAAPDLLDIDVAQVVGRLVRDGALPDPEAQEVVRDIRDAPVSRISHRPLLERVWTLREHASAYDAAYLALAEILDVPLLTSNARLALLAGHQADVHCFGAGATRA